MRLTYKALALLVAAYLFFGEPVLAEVNDVLDGYTSAVTEYQDRLTDTAEQSGLEGVTISDSRKARA